MTSWLTKRRDSGLEPVARVTLTGATSELCFHDSFRIGRDEECEVRLDTPVASRVHAEISLEDGRWYVHDLGSTNGTFLDGRRVTRAPLEGTKDVRLGTDGPVLNLSVTSRGEAGAPTGNGGHGDRQSATPPPRSTPRTSPPEAARPPAPRTSPPEAARPSAPRTSPPEAARPPAPRTSPQSARPPAPRTSPPEAAQPPAPRTSPTGAAQDPGSVTQYLRHYFVDSDGPAGERTVMIRQAFQRVQRKQSRRYVLMLSVAGVVALIAVSYAGYAHWRSQRQVAAANELFYELQTQTVEVAALRHLAEERGDAELAEQLAVVEQRRLRLAANYQGLVQELGIYRRVSDEERFIYDMARIFNESEFSIPAGFVRAVRSSIRDYWQGPGRGRFARGIRLAEERGYTPVIVRTMQRYGLPPEFFYLALQESDFNVQARGPRTRWGIAKGMWQFIPSTARRFDLRVGPRQDVAVFDPDDERHDFEKSTDAAARYLLYIYHDLAQASGLLLMASYNWGEHRIARGLEGLPPPDEPLTHFYDETPGDPRERNYWRFFTEYENRMPEETKDYVLKIFSAAVIGQNPRMFGFDFDNPLTAYLEALPPPD